MKKLLARLLNKKNTPPDPKRFGLCTHKCKYYKPPEIKHNADAAWFKDVIEPAECSLFARNLLSVINYAKLADDDSLFALGEVWSYAPQQCPFVKKQLSLSGRQRAIE